MIKTLLTSTLLIASMAQATPINICTSREVPAPSIVDFEWIKMSRFQAKYEDFYNRCGRYISDLDRAEVAANMLLRSGKGAAANKLLGALIQKAAMLPPEDADTAYPVTVEAIRGAAQIAKGLLSATSELPPKMAAEIKYVSAKKLYRVVKKAYRELDVQYYRQTNNHCFRGNCIGINTRDQFNAYADGVVELAKEFIELQTQLGSGQGTDRTELAMIGATAEAAYKVVMNSPFRRDYSCAITELYSISIEAEGFFCPGNGYNTYDFTQYLSQKLAYVTFPERGCRQDWYGHGGHGHRGGKKNHGGRGYNHNNGDDVDVDVDVKVKVDVDVDEE